MVAGGVESHLRFLLLLLLAIGLSHDKESDSARVGNLVVMVLG